MTTMIGFHKVEDAAHWAKAWQKGPVSSHEMLAMKWKYAALSITLVFIYLLSGCTTNDGSMSKVSDIIGVWNGDAQYCIGMEEHGVQPIRSAVAATFHADHTVSFSFSGVFQALPGQEEGAMGSDSHGIWRHIGGNDYEILHTDMIYKKNLEVAGFPASPASRDRNTAIFTIHPDGTASWTGESAFHDPFDLDFTGPSQGTCDYNGSFKRLVWPVSETKNKILSHSFTKEKQIMTTLIGTHEVKDSKHWQKAWQKGPGSRHEMFAKAGVAVARTFRDPENPNSVGVLFDVADMEKFQTFMASDDAKQAMAEDGLKVETLRILAEFTP